MTNYARFKANGEVSYGVVEGNTVTKITGSPFQSYNSTNDSYAVSDVKLLSPTNPSKVVAIGLNYKSHLGGRPGPEAPEPFLKASTSVIGNGDEIIIPKAAINEKVKIQPEAELAVVIG